MSDSFLALPKAQKEVLDGWEWYEDKEPGLGDRFVDEVDKKIRSIINNPLHYPAKGKYREAQTDVFPYLVIYQIDKTRDVILIVSVFHMSRHPRKKHK